MCTYGSWHCYICNETSDINTDAAMMQQCQYRYTDPDRCWRYRILLSGGFVRRDHLVCVTNQVLAQAALAIQQEDAREQNARQQNAHAGKST